MLRESVVPRKEMMAMTSTHMYRRRMKSKLFENAKSELVKAGAKDRAKHCVARVSKARYARE